MEFLHVNQLDNRQISSAYRLSTLHLLTLLSIAVWRSHPQRLCSSAMGRRDFILARSLATCMSNCVHRQLITRSLLLSRCLSSTTPTRVTFTAGSDSKSSLTVATTSNHNRRLTTATSHNTAMSANTAQSATTAASMSSSAGTTLYAAKSVQLFPASVPTLTAFYQQTHQLIQSAATTHGAPPITIVMGNESSDFDSTVSATVLALVPQRTRLLLHLTLTHPLLPGHQRTTSLLPTAYRDSGRVPAAVSRRQPSDVRRRRRPAQCESE